MTGFLHFAIVAIGLLTVAVVHIATVCAWAGNSSD